jgi:hypothetical protein
MRLPLVLAALGPALLAQPPRPDAVELLLRSAPIEKANFEKIRQYAYREYRISQEFDKDGKETNRHTETWDVIGLEGSTYRKLILRDDQPLAPKEQKREDERLAKETALRRRETPGQRSRRLLSFTYSVRSLPTERTVALFDLEFKPDEEVDGRLAHVIEGMPKPRARPANANEKENLNYRFKIWIDREDGLRVRGEMYVIGENSRMQKGTRIEWMFTRNDAGVWLPKDSHTRFDLRFLKIASFRRDWRSSFSDYRKFQVDSQVVEAEK